jgi:hypothetical protein
MLFRKIVIEKSFINWRALPLVKISTRVFESPCIIVYSYEFYKYANIGFISF